MSAVPSINIPITTSADTRSLNELTVDLKKAEAALRSMSATDPHWTQQAAQVAALRTRVAELGTATRGVEGSSRNTGNALLQLSRGAQDAQYGLAGAVNNLEGIATALGLGAGVAGVVTVLAVAVQQLGPPVIAWFKSLDVEGANLDKLKERLSEAATTILGTWTPAQENAAQSGKHFTDSLNDQKTAADNLQGSLKTALDLLKQRHALEEELGKNKADREIDTIKAKGMAPDDESRAIAAVQIKQLNDSKRRAEEAMQAEQTIAAQRVDNSSQSAAKATATRAKLEAEKDNALSFVGINEEIVGGKDKDGNVTKKGAIDRVDEAKALHMQTYASEGRTPEAMAEAENNLRREEERLAELLAMRSEIIAKNGGTENFRPIAEIDKNIGEASQHEQQQQAASKSALDEKAILDAQQQTQRERLADDYNAQAAKITGTLPDEGPQRVAHDHSLTDPFTNPQPARRNLYAEEQQGAESPYQKPGRNLYAEEQQGAGAGAQVPANSDLAKAAKEAADSGQEANNETLKALQKMAAQNKQQASKIRSMQL